MASEARIAANRANARKSTGPRTPRGKSFSRLNARKHGAWATLVALTPDERAQLAELRQAAEAEFPGQDPALLDDYAFALWRNRRAQELEIRALTDRNFPYSAAEAVRREIGSCAEAFFDLRAILYQNLQYEREKRTQ